MYIFQTRGSTTNYLYTSLKTVRTTWWWLWLVDRKDWLVRSVQILNLGMFISKMVHRDFCTTSKIISYIHIYIYIYIYDISSYILFYSILLYYIILYSINLYHIIKNTIWCYVIYLYIFIYITLWNPFLLALFWPLGEELSSPPTCFQLYVDHLQGTFAAAYGRGLVKRGETTVWTGCADIDCQQLRGCQHSRDLVVW